MKRVPLQNISNSTQSKLSISSKEASVELLQGESEVQDQENRNEYPSRKRPRIVPPENCILNPITTNILLPPPPLHSNHQSKLKIQQHCLLEKIIFQAKLSQSSDTNLCSASPNKESKAKPNSVAIRDEVDEIFIDILTDGEQEDLNLVVSTREWMREREKAYQPKTHYFEWQPHLLPEMRAVLFDWLMEVAEEYSVHRETMHVTMNFIDRFLSTVPQIPKNKFQLIGLTALFVASKIESSPFAVKDLSTLCNSTYSVSEILQMERLLVHKLDWQLMPVTVFSWLKLFVNNYCKLKAIPLTEFPRREFTKMMFILDHCALDNSSLGYLPSILAATILCKHFLSEYPLVEKITGYEESQLADCKRWMDGFASIEMTKPCTTPIELLPTEFQELQYRPHKALSFIKLKLDKQLQSRN